MTATAATPTKSLNKHQREMLDFGLQKVESIDEQIAALKAEKADRLDSLYDTFGEHVEFVNDEGRMVKFRLVKGKRVSYKAVVDTVKANSSRPMVEFIDKTIDANTSQTERKVLTAGKAPKAKAEKATAPLKRRRGGQAALTDQQAAAIRTDRSAGLTVNQIMAKHGVTKSTANRVIYRKGRYAQV